MNSPCYMPVTYTYLVSIVIPTNAHRSSTKLILQLLLHVSAFLHHPQRVYPLPKAHTLLTGTWITYGHMLPTIGLYHNTLMLSITDKHYALIVIPLFITQASTCFGTYVPSSGSAETCRNKQTNSVALVRERTIPTERPPPVGEVSANFCG
jgi:hypothetical protein